MISIFDCLSEIVCLLRNVGIVRSHVKNTLFCHTFIEIATIHRLGMH